MDVNEPPVLGSIGDLSVDELMRLTFTATATDGDVPADYLEFSLEGAPSGAYIDSDSGEFGWNTLETDGPGTYTFDVVVTDSGWPQLEDRETITVTVNEVNAAPQALTVVQHIGDPRIGPAAVVDPDFAALTTGQAFEFIDFDGDGFDSLAPNRFTPIPSGTYAAQGVTLLGLDARSVLVSSNWTHSPPIGAWQTGFSTPTDPYSFVFDEPVASFGLFGSDIEGNIAVTVHLSGGGTDSFIVPRLANQPNSTFFGYTADGNAITRIDFYSSDYHIIDDVRFGRVASTSATDYEVDEGTELSFTTAASDADLPAGGLTFSLYGAPTGASVDPVTGVFTWTPGEADGPGVFTFDVVVTDDGVPSLAGRRTVTVTVVDLDGPPVAIDDEADTDAGVPVVIAVLDNDSDPDGDALTIDGVTDPAGGSVSVNIDGTVTYTPDTGFSGVDTFAYTVTTPGGLTDSATVSVTVRPAVCTAAAATLRNGDPDLVDGAVEVTVDGTGAFGSSVGSGGDARFNPVGPVEANGTVFSSNLYVRAAGALLEEACPAVTTIESQSDTLLVTRFERGGLTFRLTQTLSPVGLTGSTLSQVYEVTAGVTEVPTRLVRHVDSDLFFDETIADRSGASDATGAQLYQFDASDTASQPATFLGISGSLGADTTPDRWTIQRFDYRDDLVRNEGITDADDTVVFGDADGDRFVDAPYDVTLSQQWNAVVPAGGTLTFTTLTEFGKAPANDAPVAADDAALTDVDTAVNVAVLANDTDVDGGPLVIVAVSTPANGTAVVEADGTVTYTPAPGYRGLDAFTYTVIDGRGGADEATVAVKVGRNVAPTADAGADRTVVEGSAIVLTGTGGDLEDPPGALTYSWTPAIDLTGAATTTPTFAGVDDGVVTLTLEVCDTEGGCATDTVDVTVTNADPVVDVGADTTSVRGATVSLVASFTDAGSLDTHTATVDGAAKPGSVTSPFGVSVTIPANAPLGVRTVQVCVVDDNGGRGCDTVAIDVQNRLPVATDDTATTPEDTPAVITVLTGDSDPDGDTLTVTSVTEPANGTATIGAAGVVTYTPRANWSGTDTFTYTVSDGFGGTATATVAVTVTPVNDAPVADAGADRTVPEGTLVNLGVSVVDVDGVTFTYSWTPAGALTGASTATPSFRPADNGSTTFTVEVCDDGAPARCSTDTVTVTATNVAPNVNAGPDRTVVAGVAFTFPVSFTDPGTADTHTATFRRGDGSALAALGAVTSPFSVTTTYPTPGTYTAQACVRDDDSGQDCDTFVVTVLPPLNLRVLDASVAEGNSGTTNLTFEVVLSVASAQTVTATWSTFSGTATEGTGSLAYPEDYRAGSGTVTFSPGVTSVKVAVAVAGDLYDEADETLFLRLLSSVNAPIADDESLGTIFDGGDECTIIGTSGADVITGTAGNDVICALGGDDVVAPLDGNDRVIGDAGIDRIVYATSPAAVTVDLSVGTASGWGSDTFSSIESVTGSNYGDTLRGSDGPNTINGLNGADVIDGRGGDDALQGNDGNDTMTGGEGADAMTGGAGNDVLRGGGGADTLAGEVGDDDLFGDAGVDTVEGGDGADLLEGGSEADDLFGNDGNDLIRGQTGADTLSGGAGADRVSGGDQGDDLFGGIGADELFGEAGDDALEGGADNDALNGGIGADKLEGQGGDDYLDGNDGNDTLSGGTGADALYGGEGADKMSGGDGNDLLSGQGGGDDLFGNDGNDQLGGGGGNDDLAGGAGSDRLDGGTGANRLNGGPGTDTCSFGPSGETRTSCELAP